jgi:hypothetical protein
VGGVRNGVRMPRARFPDALGTAFRVSEAIGAGATRSALESPELERIFHGARVRVEPARADRGAPLWKVAEKDLERRIAAYLPLMPEGAFFTGPTAAFLWGVPLPRGIHSALHVGVHHPRTAPLREGIRGVQVKPHMAGVVTRNDRRVTDPASTWASLGGSLALYDLVAAADAFIRIPRHPGGFRPPERPPHARREELSSALAAGRRRGAANLRAALERARTGSSSRKETHMRLILVDGGLAEPVLDHDVFGPHGFVGCLDAAYPAQRVGVEYEGDGHLTRRQLERDIDKYEALAALGWHVVRLTSYHVDTVPGEAVRRVRTALTARR